MLKVRNMTTDGGNTAPNQFIVIDGGITYFQSYDSIIIKQINSMEGSQIYLDAYYWDYSRTTGKYRNYFLSEGISDTRKKIETGEYLLADLNEGEHD
jgi:hypothetical protein